MQVLEAPSRQIKVVLVDDHLMMRTGLRVLLNADPAYTVVGEAPNGRKAIEIIRDTEVDVVVMDVKMPDLNGIDATRLAVAARPGVKVIGLSTDADGRTAVEMIRAGAKAYLVKDAAYEELATAIRAVMSGTLYFSRSVVSQIEQSENNASDPTSVFVRLSGREREILQLISEGKATKEVAASLQLSVKTAETHRRNIMQKLNIDNVAELTKYAIREGLTSV